jgi:competence protein ComEC
MGWDDEPIFFEEPEPQPPPPPRRRPLLAVLAGFVPGILLAEALGPLLWAWVAAGLVLALLVIMGLRRNGWALVNPLAALVLAAALGAAYTTARLPGDDHLGNIQFSGERIYRVEGVVRELPRSFHVERPFAEGPGPRRWLVSVEVEELHGGENETREVSGGLTVFVDHGRPDLVRGDRVSFVTRLRSNAHATNPGQRDMGRVYARLGSHGTGAVAGTEAVELVHRPAWYAGPRVAVGRLRRALGRRLDTVIDRHDLGPHAGLIHALLLGERHELRPGLRELLQESGTFHFLAISGLHVGIFCAFVAALLTLLGVPVRGRLLGTIGLVWFYVLLTGFHLSSVRAALTLSFVLAAPMLGRRHDALSATAAAALVILLADPQQLFLPGFQLTFAAVWAIVCIYPQLEGILWPWQDLLDELQQPEEMSFGRTAWLAARSYLLLSVTVWLATAPVLAWHFGYVSFIAPLLNLLVWPLVLMLLLVCLVLLLVLPFGPAATGLPAAAAGGLAWAIVQCAEISRFLPGYGVSVAPPPLWWLAGYYAVLVAWTLRKRVPAARPAFVGGVILLAAGWLGVDVAARLDRGPELIFTDIGSGQAAALLLPDGQVHVYDAGARAASRASILTEVLQARRVGRLDAVVISHPDADHCNFLPELARRFAIEHVLMAPAADLSQSGRRVRSELRKLDLDVRSVQEGASLRADPLHAEVLHPDARFLQRPTVPDNDQSLVIRAQIDGCTVLFTGDIEEMAIAQLLEEKPGMLQADVLVMPHHGHYARGLEELVDAVQPRLAVVSGRADDCDPRVARLLEERNVDTWITGRGGAIILSMENERLVASEWATGEQEVYDLDRADESEERP